MVRTLTILILISIPQLSFGGGPVVVVPPVGGPGDWIKQCPDAGVVNDAVQLPDQSTIFGGTFAHGLCKRSADGSVDMAFDNSWVARGTTGAVSALAILKEGSVLVAGSMTQFDQTSVSGLFKINGQTGELWADDFLTHLGPGFLSDIKSLVVLPDGNILVGGTFFDVNLLGSYEIRKFSSDGELDTDFSTQTLDGIPWNFFYHSTSQKVLVGGEMSGFFLRLSP